MKLNAGIFALVAMLPCVLPGYAAAQSSAPIAFEVLEIANAAQEQEDASRPINSQLPANARSPQGIPANFDEVEPNNTAAQATPLPGNAARVTANIFVNGDVDFWSFSGTAGDRIYAATMTSRSSNGSVDSTLDLIASDGSTVIETDLNDGTFGSTSSSIAGATLPATGNYYLRVTHASATNQLRPYDLYFQLRSGAPAAETEPNDTFPGEALPAGGWVSGSTSATTDADLYSLNLNAGDTVFISVDLDPERDTVEWNAQTGLGAFGAPPLFLVANDAGAATPDSEAFFTTVETAGTYGALIGIPAAGTTFGTYHASISVFPRVAEGVNCTTYTSTNVPVVIASGAAGIVTSTLTIPGNPRIADVDVSVNLTHNFMVDLDVQLTAPGGNTVGLFSDIGSATAGVQTTMNTTFDDEAAIPPLFTVINGNRVAPEFNYRLSWFDGQAAGGTWTLTVRDDAAGDGGNLNAWSMMVCEPPPPPTCAPGFVAQTVYSTDFEADDGGFTHSGMADEWALGLPATVATTTTNPVAGFTTCNSGTNCWKTDLTGTYNASSTQDLLSPNINLAGLSAPVIVTWAQRYQMESASYDHLFIDYQQAGGATPVRLFEWLDATMTDGPGNPVVNIPASSGWSSRSARVDSLAGLNTELLFHVDSDSSVNFGGLAIDDVTITACRALSADLQITKTDGVTSAIPGGSVTYTITASNAGPDPVTGATVADTFPAALTCTWTCAGAGGGTCAAGPVSGNINDTVNLPAGGSVIYTATCAISASATGTLSNTATVAAAGGINDPTPGNNSATDSNTVLTPQSDLGITKTDGVASAIPGSSVTYTITASNAGLSDAPGSTVADTFPAALTCTWTCAGAGGGTCAAGPVSGNINDTVNLPAGGSVIYTATCAISASATGTLSNTATVAAAGGITDPTPGNNSATDVDTLLAPANVSGTKTVTGSFLPGSAISYTIVLTNSGSGAQQDNPGNEFTDILPANLTLVSATASSGTAVASIGTNTVTWNGTIAAAASVTVTINATINPMASGIITNQGTINYDGDGDGTNESTRTTDDPGTATAGDPTGFGVLTISIPVPMLNWIGLALLSLLVAGFALRQRNT
ncbi:MAG TPA: proprotein convertase P-domain-containing protein [Pseudomonadota bacterium]|nr:proprotein convertase P-domain-containing protein [Pseudomonadota bacterium]